MTISTKKYICPVCNDESEHSTNHEGEIYTGCRLCGGSVLYFQEDTRKFKPMFNLVHYRFDRSVPEQAQEYLKMVNEISKFKHEKFSSWMSPRNSGMFFANLSNQLISVYEPESFSNQYITNKGRLFNWFEACYPNADILEGYYLIPNKQYL